jgi:hypothetical protein
MFSIYGVGLEPPPRESAGPPRVTRNGSGVQCGVVGVGSTNWCSPHRSVGLGSAEWWVLGAPIGVVHTTL